jgi:hypothetical protein
LAICLAKLLEANQLSSRPPTNNILSCASLSKIHFFSSDQIGTSGLLTAIEASELAVSAAQEIFNALPECGGAVTGDACAVAVSAAKIIGAAAIIAAETVSVK